MKEQNGSCQVFSGKSFWVGIVREVAGIQNGRLGDGVLQARLKTTLVRIVLRGFLYLSFFKQCIVHETLSCFAALIKLILV